MTDGSASYEGVDFEIGSTYDWCVRAFSVVQNRLGLNIKFHHDEGQIEKGQIFLFNHFARFETIIPQYLINQATGGILSLCCRQRIISREREIYEISFQCRCVTQRPSGGFYRFLPQRSSGAARSSCFRKAAW